MRDEPRQPGPGTAWAPYEPGAEAPWDRRRVVHLHRRAGFAATWGEVRRDLKDGHKASIDRLLAGAARADGVPKDFAGVAALLAASAGDPERLKAWWVYRMLFGPDPLTERLALMWHNHFATSIAKVNDAGPMRRQNEIFRARARAPFGELLAAVAHDPALLLWLDAPANRAGHPNENLARELMELFTLGIGHYTEADVKEAARALTGWTVAEDKFRDEAARHDGGEKTVLGRTGRWTGDDLVKILLTQSATAERLAWRLCEQFLGEGAATAADVKALADGLRRRGLDVGWGVETVLRSRAFFAEANLGRRVTGPAEFTVAAARALEMFDAAPSTLVLADWSARLGQDLFQPPNVGGWPGGRQWVSAQSMIGRANFAADLVRGTLTRDRRPFDAVEWARRHGRGADLTDFIAFCGDLLLTGARPDDRVAVTLGAEAKLNPETARRVVVLILASPEAQLA
jgi:hypothetical protein